MFSWSLVWVTFFKLYFEIISQLHKLQRIPIYTSLKFTECIHSYLPRLFVYTKCLLGVHMYVYIHTCVHVWIFFWTTFENRLQISRSFTPKYFSVYFLRMKVFTYIVTVPLSESPDLMLLTLLGPVWAVTAQISSVVPSVLSQWIREAGGGGGLRTRTQSHVALSSLVVSLVPSPSPSASVFDDIDIFGIL